MYRPSIFSFTKRLITWRFEKACLSDVTYVMTSRQTVLQLDNIEGGAYSHTRIDPGLHAVSLQVILVINPAVDCYFLPGLLAPLLPSVVCTPYHLRPRRHNRQLIPKVNRLCDSNFIQRMLYKDSY